jgi:hypothetical protein
MNAQYRILWMFDQDINVVYQKNVAGVKLYGQGSALVDGFGYVG